MDNPSFWTNLSVLSGLASGYCERLAVAKLASAGTAVTAGAKVTLVSGNTWTMGPTIAADVTANDNIVSKVINGFALGKTDAALFTTSQAVFRPVGTSLGSNYMRAVDSAIVSMCNIPGGYVQGANDTDAYTFSDLATAAKTRSEIESVAGSAVAKPTANGGVLARKGALAYPVAWAKQRKWMLDTLRYTGSSVAVTGTSVGTFTAQRISGSATNDTTFTSRGTTTETGVFISGLADLSGKINQAKIGDISYRLTGILPGQTAANQNITLYLDPHAAAHEDSPRYIDYGSLTRVTAVQQAANEQS